MKNNERCSKMIDRKLCEKCALDDDCLHEGICSETYFVSRGQKLPKKIKNGRCPDFVPLMNFADECMGELDRYEED